MNYQVNFLIRSELSLILEKNNNGDDDENNESIYDRYLLIYTNISNQN